MGVASTLGVPGHLRHHLHRHPPIPVSGSGGSELTSDPSLPAGSLLRAGPTKLDLCSHRSTLAVIHMTLLSSPNST